MKFSHLEFILEEALTGIRRNGLMAFASVTTIALSMGVLGAFVLIALGANNFTGSQVGRFQIAVFVKGDQVAANRTASAIREMDGVRSVEIRDREAEWVRVKRENPNIELAGLPRNFLPYALDVKVADPASIPLIAAKIRVLPGIDGVQENRATLKRVLAAARLVKLFSIAGTAVLLVTSMFIISNAIKLTLYARRREIRIMQLVGATNQFIRLPLVIEGMVLGAIGAFAAWLLIVLGSSYVAHLAHNITPMLGHFSSGIEANQLAAMLVVLGTIIGAAGSFVSIRRFLHD